MADVGSDWGRNHGSVMACTPFRSERGQITPHAGPFQAVGAADGGCAPWQLLTATHRALLPRHSLGYLVASWI